MFKWRNTYNMQDLACNSSDRSSRETLVRDVQCNAPRNRVKTRIGASSRFTQLRDYSVRRSLREITVTRVDHAENERDSPILYFNISPADPDRPIVLFVARGDLDNPVLANPRSAYRHGPNRASKPPSRRLETYLQETRWRKGREKKTATSNTISFGNPSVTRFLHGKQQICLILTSLN